MHIFNYKEPGNMYHRNWRPSLRILSKVKRFRSSQIFCEKQSMSSDSDSLPGNICFVINYSLFYLTISIHFVVIIWMFPLNKITKSVTQFFFFSIVNAYPVRNVFLLHHNIWSHLLHQNNTYRYYYFFF